MLKLLKKEFLQPAHLYSLIMEIIGKFVQLEKAVEAIEQIFLI